MDEEKETEREGEREQERKEEREGGREGRREEGWKERRKTLVLCIPERNTIDQDIFH